MSTAIYLDSKIKIEKEFIIKIGKKIRKHFSEYVLPKGHGIAHYKFDGSLHTYEFNLEAEFSEEESEKLVSIFYYVIPHDFDLELDTEVSEDGEPEEEEYEEISEASKHEQWMQTQISEGWRYGMQYNEKDKTNPLLRPFYQLTENQLTKLKEIL